jgi:hypothetical protein
MGQTTENENDSARQAVIDANKKIEVIEFNINRYTAAIAILKADIDLEQEALTKWKRIRYEAETY